jgi:hypothetical protein
MDKCKFLTPPDFELRLLGRPAIPALDTSVALCFTELQLLFRLYYFDENVE